MRRPDLNLRSYEEFEAEAKDMSGDSIVAEIEAVGGTALRIEVDVTDHTAVAGVVARVMERWGRVDILVANAGGGRGRPMDTKASNLDPALPAYRRINLFGTVYTVNAIAPVMKEQRSGKIITVSSIAGTGPSGRWRLWPLRRSESRHRPLHPVASQDLGAFAITANCIAPGVIATRRTMATVARHS